jgi:hypothetical protein
MTHPRSGRENADIVCEHNRRVIEGRHTIKAALSLNIKQLHSRCAYESEARLISAAVYS